MEVPVGSPNRSACALEHLRMGLGASSIGASHKNQDKLKVIASAEKSRGFDECGDLHGC